MNQLRVGKREDFKENTIWYEWFIIIASNYTIILYDLSAIPDVLG